MTKKKFEIAFCLNAINHFSNLQLSLNKLVDLVKPGGKIVLSIDAHNFSFFKHLFRIIPVDILHPHQFDLDEYEEMLHNRNCKILKSTRLENRYFFNYYVLIAEKMG